MKEQSPPFVLDPQEIGKLLLSIFSWIFLSAIAIIISGKLMAKRIPLGIREDDYFVIPLLILRIRARGDEVSLGFLMFVVTLGLVIFVGGAPAYQIFKDRSGLDIGQWNSLCAIASFFSLAISGGVWCVAPLFASVPLISKAEREEQLENLKNSPGGD